MSSEARIVVCGAAGRMGRTIVRLATEHPEAKVVGALEAPGHAEIGRDVGELAGVGPLGVPIGDDLSAMAGPDAVLLDFTTPTATLEHLDAAVASGAAIAIGTTGFTNEQRAHIDQVAGGTRTVIAANMSVGVNVLLRLVDQAARALGEGFDPEIVEMHHRHKVDAPSGTALALGRAVAAATGRDFGKEAVYGREGHVGPRTDGEIGIMTLRGGDTVGDHTVYFAGTGERIELTHRSLDRACLASGAVRAGVWLSRCRTPGIYSMMDVLGLSG